MMRKLGDGEPDQPPSSLADSSRKLVQEETSHAREIQEQFEALEGRDVQLWSIVILMILVIGAAFVALLLPNVMWNLGTLRVEGRYFPQLVFGFIALIILFNIYVLEQKGALRKTRKELLHQTLRREAAEKLAVTDPLTGAFNRRYMDAIIRKEVNWANRHGTSLAFLMIDVDDFKSVNTRFGHFEGDHFLWEVAQLLARVFRRSDTVVRYGGDEFLVVLPEANEEQAQRALERLRREVDSWNRAHPGLGYQMSLSCGVAAHDKAVEVMETIALADTRLYWHKGSQGATD